MQYSTSTCIVFYKCRLTVDQLYAQQCTRPHHKDLHPNHLNPSIRFAPAKNLSPEGSEIAAMPMPCITLHLSVREAAAGQGGGHCISHSDGVPLPPSLPSSPLSAFSHKVISSSVFVMRQPPQGGRGRHFCTEILIESHKKLLSK